MNPPGVLPTPFHGNGRARSSGGGKVFWYKSSLIAAHYSRRKKPTMISQLMTSEAMIVATNALPVMLTP